MYCTHIAKLQSLSVKVMFNSTSEFVCHGTVWLQEIPAELTTRERTLILADIFLYQGQTEPLSPVFIMTKYSFFDDDNNNNH